MEKPKQTFGPTNTYFLGGLVVNNLPANAGDVCSIPGSGRSPGEGSGNPLQESCLENAMDKTTVQGVTKSCTWLSDRTTMHTMQLSSLKYTVEGYLVYLQNWANINFRTFSSSPKETHIWYHLLPLPAHPASLQEPLMCFLSLFVLQSLSHVWLFVPMDCSRLGCPVLHHFSELT